MGGLSGQSGVLSVDSIQARLSIDPIEFQNSNSNIKQINQIHSKLINSISYYLILSDSNPTSTDFGLIASGKPVNLVSPAVPASAERATPLSIISIDLDGNIAPTTPLYQAIDRSLVSNDHAILFERLPSSLILQLNQQPNSRSSQVIPQQTIHLDRYLLANKDSILETRNQLVAEEEVISQLKLKQSKLEATKKSQPPSSLTTSAIDLMSDHKDELNLLLNSIASRQESIAAQLDRFATRKQTAFDNLSSAGGEYNLSSVMIRNGLNGRSSWSSVVLGDDGNYHSITDSATTKVELSSALNDKTGLFLGAGVGFAFYQQAEAMRVRGGAQEEEDDDEVGDLSDEDYLDEEEVELGRLLRFEAGQKFDVDLGVGKVGGKPVWLDPSNPLDYNKLLCQSCGELMSFLLQLNSPDDTRPHANARTLYLFACRHKDCQFQTKLFRTQSPSPNNFFPHTQETIARRSRLGKPWRAEFRRSCLLTGAVNRPTESLLDPVTGLGGDQPTSLTKPFVFKEYSIECEEEPYEESYLPRIDHNPVNDQIEGDDQQAKDTKVAVDRTFLEFQQR